jgi:hypothetical protein
MKDLEIFIEKYQDQFPTFRQDLYDAINANELRNKFAFQAMPIAFKLIKNELDAEGNSFDFFGDSAISISDDIKNVAALSFCFADAMIKEMLGVNT